MKNFATFRIGLLGLLQVMIAFACYSQGSSDTIIVNKTKFVNALQAGLEGKVYKEQRDLLLNQVDTLKARISIKDMQIVNLNAQISDYRGIVSSKDAIISTQGEQRKIWEASIEDLKREVRKQIRSKKWTAVVGLLSTGIVTFFLFKK